MSGRAKDLLTATKKAGWAVHRHGKGHLIVRCPCGSCPQMGLPTSPGSHKVKQAVQNKLAKCPESVRWG